MSLPHKFPQYREGATGYKNGCRCDACTLAACVPARARSKAATLFRKMHPEMWEAILAETYQEMEVQRHPTGRPQTIPGKTSD